MNASNISVSGLTTVDPESGQGLNTSKLNVASGLFRLSFMLVKTSSLTSVGSQLVTDVQ